MRRRLFSIVTVMSLLMCVSSVAMWVWSLSYSDYFGFHGDSVRIGAGFYDGWFYCGSPSDLNGEGWFYESDIFDGQIDVDVVINWYQESSEYGLSFAGVHFYQGVLGYRWLVFIPLWLTTLLTLPAPLLWLIFFRKNSRRYRLAQGLCGGCGYDMRASEGACPECGFDWKDVVS